MASVEIYNGSSTPLTITSDLKPSVDENNEIESLPDIDSAFTDLKGGMFDDLDSSDGNVIDGSLEESVSSSDSKNECKICREKLETPRVLSCLHVFCEPCIDKLINKEDEMPKGTINCPDCDQSTNVGTSASSLPRDLIQTNIIDLSAVEPGTLLCTSCKSSEMAISRCNDCANFLCACCDNAHKYMRCFENHQVVILDDLRNSDEKVSIHKPILCESHKSENLKYYCFKCQVPVCNDCVTAGDHKGAEHQYESIAEAEKRMRSDVEELVANARAKIIYCDDASIGLSNALTELQTQHDTARGLIDETYKRFKKVLNDCHTSAQRELESLHSERELKIMDLLHTMEKSVDRTENAFKFTRRVMEQANGAEFLSLKKVISTQFLNLITNTPKADVNFSLEFDTKFDKFEPLVQESFGKFRTESTPPSPKESTPPPTLPGMPPLLNKSNNQSNSSQGALTGSVTASSPISLPTSMQSSFDGDLSGLGNNFMMPSSVLSTDTNSLQQSSHNGHMSNGPPTPSVNGSANNGPMSGISSMAEYNLHRLANLVDSNDMPDSIAPAANPSPVPQFSLADLISDQRAFSNNLLALSKLGFNNNEMSSNPLLNHRSENLLTDYPMNSSASPIGPMSSINEGMGLNLAGNGMAGRIKATPMQIRFKFGSLGPSKAQFNSPHGFCLGVDEEIIVADTNNHRIQVFEKDGSFKFQFGVPGKEEGQLWYPRKVAVMRSSSKFVVCDRGNERSRMQIFTKNGHFIKKIAIRYIDIVAGLAVTNEGHIVAVDSVSPTVFVISEDGDLVHWFDCSDHMREPSDIAISGTDFYVCDFKGHCVAVFAPDGSFKYRIGNEKITCFPNGIDISDAGDILIGDSHGNRFHVACFSRDGVLQSEFECPHVKVSRCCGLKITSEGYVVTLAKNNHHVLVLNTLYIQ